MGETFVTVIVYDVTDKASFEEAMQRWYPATQAVSPESFKLLVGSKVDMISERAVEIDGIEDMRAGGSCCAVACG